MHYMYIYEYFTVSFYFILARNVHEFNLYESVKNTHKKNNELIEVEREL